MGNSDHQGVVPGQLEELEVMTCDLLVAGSGAGGMTSAIVARKNGLDVIVAEKEPVMGGTTALSGGYLWVPNNTINKAAGTKDSVDAARTYLQYEAGNQFDADRVEAFLREGPRMVDFMQENTEVRFDPAIAFSDYHPDAPGGLPGGRSILTRPVRGSMLAEDLGKVRRARPELTLFGLTIGSGKELWHFYRATRKISSAAYVARRLFLHGLDLLTHGRGMLLSNGNALSARLLRTARDLDIPVWLDSPVRSLTRNEEGAVTGALVRTPQGLRRIVARKGVVLACGGFSQDVERRKSLYPHAAAEGEHVSSASPGNTGDGVRLGQSVGGNVVEGYPNHGAWAPTSLVPRKDGTKGPFPHFIDRGKPGVIAVLRNGRRFVNEANSYHDFVQAMVRATPRESVVEAFLIVDHRTIRRYGLGYVKPAPLPLGPAIRSGYLIRGETLAELARNAGIDASQLDAVVAQWNADLKSGVDSAFGKGSTAYNRFHGDPEVSPNPCMAPIATAPFYAVRVIPGDIGTFTGLRADAKARVLDATMRPVPGLYAAGNDMASVAGGNYVGGGITLGPAMTFGYIAARHAAGIEEKTS
jgi:succinate dehydrogenase/fumarate reductase flavoprotein subunit